MSLCRAPINAASDATKDKFLLSKSWGKIIGDFAAEKHQTQLFFWKTISHEYRYELSDAEGVTVWVDVLFWTRSVRPHDVKIHSTSCGITRAAWFRKQLHLVQWRRCEWKKNWNHPKITLGRKTLILTGKGVYRRKTEDGFQNMSVWLIWSFEERSSDKFLQIFEKGHPLEILVYFTFLLKECKIF